MMMEFIASNRWAPWAIGYSVGFWAVLMWVFVEARKAGRSHALLYAFAIALVFPLGIFIHIGNRNWD